MSQLVPQAKEPKETVSNPHGGGSPAKLLPLEGPSAKSSANNAACNSDNRTVAVMQPTASPMSFGAQVIVQEGEARIKLCQEIAVGGKLPQQEMMLDPYRPGKEVVEYSNGFNFVTILGELLAHNRARRLTRIVIEDSTLSENDKIHTSCCESEYIPNMPGLGASELRYLREKQAFHLPAEPHWYSS